LLLLLLLLLYAFKNCRSGAHAHDLWRGGERELNTTNYPKCFSLVAATAALLLLAVLLLLLRLSLLVTQAPCEELHVHARAAAHHV
jgi:hypothetical protein